MPFPEPTLWDYLKLIPKTLYWRFIWTPEEDRMKPYFHVSRYHNGWSLGLTLERDRYAIYLAIDLILFWVGIGFHKDMGKVDACRYDSTCRDDPWSAGFL